MRFFSLFILLAFSGGASGTSLKTWRELRVGDSLAAAKAIFGDPREVRGNTVLFGPHGDWVEVVMQVEGEVVQGFTAHWKKPTAEIFSEEVFELKEPSPASARSAVRFIGQPSRGWLVKIDREGRVLSLSVGKPFIPKATATDWATAVKKSWEEKR
jgi:hypothetical protein